VDIAVSVVIIRTQVCGFLIKKEKLKKELKL
jgi:hypothetical protein